MSKCGSNRLPIYGDDINFTFMNSYTSPEVASAFEAFWSNTADLQDKFIGYWRVVATKFANNSNVLGYDIINEPFAANLYKD